MGGEGKNALRGKARRAGSQPHDRRKQGSPTTIIEMKEMASRQDLHYLTLCSQRQALALVGASGIGL